MRRAKDGDGAVAKMQRWETSFMNPGKAGKQVGRYILKVSTEEFDFID